MVKAIALKKNPISKNIHFPKDGFIQKKKNQKFKQTPVGKVVLLNGSKAHNNNNMKQQDLKKQENMSPQQKKKGIIPNNAKISGLSKKELPKKKAMLDEEEDDSDSEVEDDINEGVVLENESTIDETDDSEEEDESDEDDEGEQRKNVLNILGHSLADESDDDDDDYEASEVKNAQIKKGVKMFKGLMKSDTSHDSSKDNTNSTFNDSDNDDDEDSDESEEQEDEDINEEVDEEEDDESSEVDEEEEEVEDEDNEVDSESEEEDMNEPALGLKALVDNTIVDDDEDDEDFVEPCENDEDDDISDEEEEEEESKVKHAVQKRKSKKVKDDLDASLEKMKTDKKTIFIGNLPKDVTKVQLNKLFKKFGPIVSIRIRGTISKSLNIPKKVAAITKQIHSKVKSVFAYIMFASEECVKAALSMNGTLFEGHYLRVDTVDKSEEKHNSKQSVFLGNLPFNIDENAVRKHFEQCGEILSVRVIRDNRTGVSRGFGYVNFKTEDAATLALELNGTTLSKRVIRVKLIQEHQKNKKDKKGKRSHSSKDEHHVACKRSKNNTENAVAAQRDEKKKHGKEQTSPQQGKAFQGQKAEEHKKKRKNKLEKKKQILANKLIYG